MDPGDRALTADALAARLQIELGPSCASLTDRFIVEAESIDRSVVYAWSRYGKGEGDEYLNIPLDKSEYEAFIDAVLTSPKVTPHDFEKPKYFEGCLPLEVTAERGRELAIWRMKPVGLPDPRTGREPYGRCSTLRITAARPIICRLSDPHDLGAQTQVFRALPVVGGEVFKARCDPPEHLRQRPRSA